MKLVGDRNCGPGFMSNHCERGNILLDHSSEVKLNGGIAWHKDDFHILMTTSSSHNTVSLVVGN